MIKLKQFGWLTGLCLAATAAHGATALITNINAPLINPALNAVSVVNNTLVTASNTTFTFELFKMQNVLNLTNKVSGRFVGYPGYDFSTITNSVRLPLANFVNQGTINATSGIVDIFATNLVNPGNITVAADGVARLKGFDMNLSRATIQAGSGAYQELGFNNVLTRQYWNPGLIQDIYWGTGENQRLTGRFPFDQTLDLPEAMYFSPLHEVTDRRVGGRTFLQITNSGVNPFSVYVYQRRTQPTNYHYYVVYLATNTVDTNVFADVRFFDNGNDNDVYVEISATPDTDAITGAPIDNRLCFVDRLGVQGNSVLSTGFVLDGGGFLSPSGTSRPRGFEILRSTPGEYTFGFTSNSTLGTLYANPVIAQVPQGVPYDIKAISGNPDQTIFNFIGPFSPGGSNQYVINAYAAYGAEIGSSVFGTQLHPGSPGLSDPTNAVGRVEIEGRSVDLSLARLRAENLLSIRSTNNITVSNTVLDAPNVNLYLTNTTKPALTLTNILGSAVKRFNGQIYAWAADWQNDYLLQRPVGGVSNATAYFHVLVLDISKVGISQDVVTDRLVVNSTNVIINNTLRPGRSFVIDAHAVTFQSNNVLNLFSFSAADLGGTNLPNVMHFTNQGVVSVAGLAKFGIDREQPFINMVNTGSILAASGSVRSRYFQNTGSFTANGGALDVTADDADIKGTFSSASDILLAGRNLVLNGHVASAAGALNLIATNSLSDSGVAGTNVITCGYGFNLPIKPALGDLLGTAITSTVPAFAAIPHQWAGENRGATAAGFTDNTALGRLAVSCAGNFSLASFTGAGTSNALYVDRLELLGSAETNFANVLSIDPNIVLYFASANVPPESLDGQFDGRLRWVRSYLGPNSSSNVTLASGQTITVNASLLASTAIDSDGDGTSNGADASPFDGVAIDSRVTFVGDPPTAAQISWNAAAQTTYRVEFTTALSSTPVWELLTTYVHSATTNAVVTVTDANLGGTQRYYRVSYSPQ